MGVGASVWAVPLGNWSAVKANAARGGLSFIVITHDK
jgi:hypothetical protein